MTPYSSRWTGYQAGFGPAKAKAAGDQPIEVMVVELKKDK
jgi:hypothetical protein